MRAIDRSCIDRKVVLTEKNSGPEEGVKSVVEDVKDQAARAGAAAAEKKQQAYQRN
jgi:hypothetical protein